MAQNLQRALLLEVPIFNCNTLPCSAPRAATKRNSEAVRRCCTQTSVRSLVVATKVTTKVQKKSPSLRQSIFIPLTETDIIKNPIYAR
jgi:hypothetical protein